MKTCDSCAWWVVRSESVIPAMRKDDEGECRAHAPRPHAVIHAARAEWPRTRRADGCGEHEPLPEPEPVDTRPPPPPMPGLPS